MNKHTFNFEGDEYEVLHPKVNIPGLGVRTAAEICVDKKAQAMLVHRLGGETIRKISEDISDDGLGDDFGESPLTGMFKELDAKVNATLLSETPPNLSAEEELEQHKEALKTGTNPTPAVPGALKE